MAFDRILKRLRDKVWRQHYVITLHARAEMVEDELDRFDLELTILSGQIVRRQRDQNTGEWKYCVRGYSVDGDDVEVIVKIGPTQKVVFITVYKP